jgi:hypothetical protein
MLMERSCRKMRPLFVLREQKDSLSARSTADRFLAETQITVFSQVKPQIALCGIEVEIRMAFRKTGHGPFVSQRGQTDPPAHHGSRPAVLLRLRRDQLFVAAAACKWSCAGQGRQAGSYCGRTAQGKLTSGKLTADGSRSTVRQFVAWRSVIGCDGDEACITHQIDQNFQPHGHDAPFPGNKLRKGRVSSCVIR